ncbi:hypothetical protein HPY31_21600 [Brevibacillus sp. HB1.3]|uniref:hypothetical protein n=1 Tax=Brevibacillus sp. HB1.3 TaxID=2738842 RepID=UPI001555C961|nr:hypothetical protein [Brevibacillus sp. HB1.3]NQF16474.1 hypothetical protein [Brevibacillus sp. HB1.3]
MKSRLTITILLCFTLVACTQNNDKQPMKIPVEISEVKTFLNDIQAEKPLGIQGNKMIVDWTPDALDELDKKMDELLPTLEPVEKVKLEKAQEQTSIIISFDNVYFYFPLNESKQEKLYLKISDDEIYELKGDVQKIQEVKSFAAKKGII